MDRKSFARHRFFAFLAITLIVLLLNIYINFELKSEVERLDGVVAQKQFENDDLRNTADDLDAANLILSDANATMGVENQRLVTENEKLKAAAIEVAPIDANALLEQANQILETTNP